MTPRSMAGRGDRSGKHCEVAWESVILQLSFAPSETLMIPEDGDPPPPPTIGYRSAFSVDTTLFGKVSSPRRGEIYSPRCVTTKGRKGPAGSGGSGPHCPEGLTVTVHRPIQKSRSGPPPSTGGGRGHARRGPGRQQDPAGAVGGGVEEGVRGAAQRRRLTVVRHDVGEGCTLAHACDRAALPAVRRPPVQKMATDQSRPEVRGRRRIHHETCRR